MCCVGNFAVVSPALANSQAAPGAGSLGAVEHIGLWLATIFAWIAQQVVIIIVVLIDIVIVPIMQYNHFVDAQIVTQGWTVVRDLVNMFFVVILLIIAFQTIFNIGKADWKRQVPRLLIMAVVINFSRTIAGILIDFGQVIMFTFVNAIADVAGGNFIQLFGLDKLFSYSNSQIATAATNGTGFEVFDFFGAAFLTMILTFIILATMIILAALLAFRIVILWCLVILSPLTFFLGGIKDGWSAESHYADWWKRFTAAVSIGPILTFFVWLALAAASTGNLSEKQGFEQQTDASGEAASIGGNITEAFDAPHLTSLIIAIALLFAGFEVAQTTAASMGGRAGALASSGIQGIPGLAKSLAKVGVPLGLAGGAIGTATVGLGAAGIAGAAYGGGLLGGAGLVGGAIGANVVAGRVKGKYLGVKRGVGAGLRDMGVAMTQIPGANYFGAGQIGRRVAGVGTGLVQGVGQTEEKDLAEAQKAVSGMDMPSRLAMLDSLKGSTRDKDVVTRQAIVTSSLLSKETMKAMDPEQRQQVADTWYTEVAGKADDATLDKVGKVMSNRPELSSGQAVKDHQELSGAALEAERQKEVNKQVATYKRGDIANIKSDSVKDKKVRNALRDTKIGDESIESLILSGKYGGTELRKAYEEAMVGERSGRGNALTARMGEVGTAQREAAGTATSGSGNVATELLKDAISELSQEISKLSAEDIKGGVVTPAMMANPQFFDNFADGANDQAMSALKENPALMAAFNEQKEKNPKSVAANQAVAAAEAEEAPIEARRAAAAQVVIDRVVDPFDQEKGDAAKRRELAAIDAQYNQEINALRAARPAPTVDPDLVRYTKASVRAGQPPVGYDEDRGTFSSGMHEQAFKEMVINNPTVVANMSLKADDMGKAVGRSIAEAMDVGNIKSLIDKAMSASGQDQTRVIDSLRTIKEAIAANSTSVTDAVGRLAAISSFQRKTGRK